MHVKRDLNRKTQVPGAAIIASERPGFISQFSDNFIKTRRRAPAAAQAQSPCADRGRSALASLKVTLIANRFKDPDR